MKIRVCFIIPTLDQGGAEKQTSLLARGLNRDEFEAIVIVLTRTGPREAELIESGIAVHHINKSSKLDPFAWLRLRKLLKQLKPDIVHSWLFAANAYGRTAAMSARVPVVLGSERSVDPWKNGYQFWIDKQIGKRTQGLTANSLGTIDFYQQHGIPASWFEMIPNGIEPMQPSRLSREEACQRMGVSPDRRIVLSIGRLWAQKGYKDLLWAAELLRVMREDICYVIIGDGPDRERLELYRDNIRGASQIFFLGHRTDAQDLLSHCDLLWNGSLYEGQSNVILEAMQSGVAVIASDIPGNRELIIHDQTGLLYPLGNVDDLTRYSNQLLSDPARRQSLVERAKAHVQTEHSIEQMIARHAKLYREKLNTHKVNKP
jgi:glycosyltransferase involved in cell wall biosynthesis